jgi:glycosyltransferase involved in cell wall biosynthesis
MKVLLCHTFYRTAAPSGEDAVFHNERALLESNGIDVLTYEKHNDDLADTAIADKIRNGIECVWSRRSYLELRALLDHSKPDIAHFHNTFPQLSPSVYAACAESGVPVVQTLHNYRFICPNGLLLRDERPCEDCISGSLFSSLRHRCYRNSLLATSALTANIAFNRLNGSFKNSVHRYIALTQFAKDRFIAGGLPAHRIRVKPNFLDDVPEVVTKDDYAIFVGRLTQEKGVNTLIQAWTQLGGAIPLKVVGDGALRPQLEDSVRRLGLPIQFLGKQSKSEVLKLVGGAKLQVIPSEWYEGFPMVVLEAFASRTPVIASRIGSLAEIIQDKINGLHFTAGDSTNLATSIKLLWNDRELLKSLGNNGRATYDENYNPQSNFRHLMEIYREAQDEFFEGALAS